MKKNTESKSREIYLTISISVITIGLILTFFYRPFITERSINDFGLADTIGSLASVIGFCFFIWGFKDYSNIEKNKQILIVTLIYAFIWEIFGLLKIYGTFDIKDINNKGAVRIVNGKIAGTTKCLVTGTIWVGLNRITEENVEQWLYRCSILRKHGYELGVDEDNPDKKWWPSQDYRNKPGRQARYL